MTTDDLYPLRFAPMFQYRLWGGRDLGEFMNTDLPGDDPIGEAWILSDRADFASKIENGPLAGRTLTDLMRTRKSDVLGRQAARFDRFPLLLKFLDVEKMLSVQVHPRDDQTDLIPAGDTGKTEAWVVLRAKPEGRIYAGLKPGTTAQDLRALNADSADSHLASFKPEAGQGVMIEAGTVHSLGDGVMVFEVQENSDVTFRLYDWGHVDTRTGQPVRCRSSRRSHRSISSRARSCRSSPDWKLLSRRVASACFTTPTST
jgi:mannose-6-phosphate isomerase